MNCRAIPSVENGRSYNGHYMAVGRNAEEIVMEWLTEHPSIVGVEDLRSLRPMREADVDISICLYDGRVALAEIKSDYHLGKTENVLFEVLRINHTCGHDHAVTLGWSARSPAKWVLFYAPQVNSIYTLSFSEYRKAAQAFTKDCEPTKHLITTRTDEIKTTINLLIPQRYFSGMKIYKLNQA